MDELPFLLVWCWSWREPNSGLAGSEPENSQPPLTLTISYLPLTIRLPTMPRRTACGGRLFPRDHFLDFAKLLLAEKHFLADEERRRTERAALDGGLGVLDQSGLYIGVLRARQQFGGIEAGRGQR